MLLYVIVLAGWLSAASATGTHYVLYNIYTDPYQTLRSPSFLGGSRSQAHKVVHIFKVAANNRHIVLSQRVDSGVSGGGDTARLEARASSVIRATQRPMQRSCDFLSHQTGRSCTGNEAVQFSDTDFAYIRLAIRVPRGMSVSDYESLMKSLLDVDLAQVVGKAFKSEIFVSIGVLYPRMFLFVNLDNASIQKLVDHYMQVAGGPGRVQVNMQHLIDADPFGKSAARASV